MAQAAEEMVSEGRKELKRVTGTIVAIGKRSMSLEYTADKNQTYELLLPFAKEMRFESVKGLAELKAGDTVEVSYEQTVKDGDKGERVVLKTVVTRIALVKPAPARTALSSAEVAP